MPLFACIELCPGTPTKDSLSSFKDDLSLNGTPVGENEGEKPCGGLPVEVCLPTDQKARGPGQQCNLWTLMRMMGNLFVDDGHIDTSSGNKAVTLGIFCRCFPARIRSHPGVRGS